MVNSYRRLGSTFPSLLHGSGIHRRPFFWILDPCRRDRQLFPKHRWEITTATCVITQKSAILCTWFILWFFKFSYSPQFLHSVFLQQKYIPKRLSIFIVILTGTKLLSVTVKSICLVWNKTTRFCCGVEPGGGFRGRKTRADKAS